MITDFKYLVKMINVCLCNSNISKYFKFIFLKSYNPSQAQAKIAIFFHPYLTPLHWRAPLVRISSPAPALAPLPR